MLPILFHRNRPHPAARTWDPFAGMSRLLDLADQPLSCECGFNVDVREDDARFLIEADLPGLERDDVEVTVEDGELKIAIERKQDETRRMVQRAFKLENARKKGAQHFRRYAIPHTREVAERLQQAGHRVVYQEFLDLCYQKGLAEGLHPQ